MATITRTTTTVTRTITQNPVRPHEGPARGWLKFTGFLFLAVAVLGLFAAARDAAHSFAFHLEGVQDVLHWMLGVAALAVAYAVRDRLAVAVAAIALGAVLLALGLLGLLNPDVGGWHVGAGDNLLHLLLGTIAVLVGLVSLNRERDWMRRHPQPGTTVERTDVVRPA